MFLTNSVHLASFLFHNFACQDLLDLQRYSLIAKVRFIKTLSDVLRLAHFKCLNQPLLFRSLKTRLKMRLCKSRTNYYSNANATYNTVLDKSILIIRCNDVQPNPGPTECLFLR